MPITWVLNPLGKLLATGTVLFSNLILTSDMLLPTHTVWSIVFVELNNVNSALALTVIWPVKSGESQPWLFKAITL